MLNNPMEARVLRVKESLPVEAFVQLVDSGLSQIMAYLQAKEFSSKVKAACPVQVDIESFLPMHLLSRCARVILLCVLVTSIPLTSALRTHALDEAPLRIAMDERTSELTILYNQQPVLVYAFSAVQPKPYIKQIHTMSGWNVLADAPTDHSHHHGVMYGLQVNGHNFWQEPPDAGIQQSVMIEGQRVKATTGGGVRNWVCSCHQLAGRSGSRIYR